MLDREPEGGERTGTPDATADDTTTAPAAAPRKRAPRRKAAAPAVNGATSEPGAAIEAQDAEEAREVADQRAAGAPADSAADPAPVEAPAAPARRRRKAVAAAPAAEPAPEDQPEAVAPAPVTDPTAGDGAEVPAPVKATRSRRKKAVPAAAPPAESGLPEGEPAPGLPAPTAATAPAASIADDSSTAVSGPVADGILVDEDAEEPVPPVATGSRRRSAPLPPVVLFMAPDPAAAIAEPVRRTRRRPAAEAEPIPAVPAAEADEDEIETPVTADVAEDAPAEPVRRSRRRGRRADADELPPVVELEAPDESADDVEDSGDDDSDDDDDDSAAGRRRRRRGRRGRGRGKGTAEDGDDIDEPVAAEEEPEDSEEEGEDGEGLTRRRRRRRRKGSGDDTGATGGTEDGVHTVVRIREPRTRERSDEVQGVSGSTRLEAKRQRRRDGREQRRTRPPILSESEFLARREAVDRVMVIRQKSDRTQIAVLEDGVLVEHYVARATSGTMVGNVYLGKVQNVLPSMEAAFVDVGRGRNAVLYAGEVNWDATGLEGRSRSIEQALRSGDPVMVQVTKDPIGHKGARLSSHIALSGRHLVYVPNGNASGISRKLPDNERKRLRDILKKLVPDGAGVIVRTAAEGASEDELARDVKRLQGQWEDIQARAAEGNAPAQLSEEPDLVVRVVRDLFNEDFRELVIEGEQAYREVESYLDSVSPDLVERLHRHSGPTDVFADRRIDEQILKGLDRKVFLPSGGHLVIDRTEAMTVVDVNTGKYTGAGGNLEETVTRNNLEAAEETVRQLRLRDIGGIIVIDFIDMVLESNRDLVLRRLTECLGRDRTKHQVTEITSLGLVQMTRKRIGAGLLEVFSENCEHCKGRGLIVHTEPVPEKGGRPAGGAADKVKAVASATTSPVAAPAATGPSNGSANGTSHGSANGRESGRRRGRGRGAAETVEIAEPATTDIEIIDATPADRPAPVERPVAPAAPAVASAAPVAGSGVIGVAPVAAGAAAQDDEYDMSGYDLSRYEIPDSDDEDDDEDDAEPLQLTGSDDPDAGEDDDEPAGTGARRRSRRGSTRRRTRP